MNASQASEKSNSRNLGFSGLVNKVLTEMGHEVTWKSPSIYITDDELNRFDSVIVGVAPLTSLSSDRVFGALSIINKLWSSDKLSILLDSPTPSQISSSINSLVNNPESFSKPFFSYRKEYSSVVSDKNYLNWLFSTVKILKDEPWVNTFYPKLPWRMSGDIKLPFNAKNNLHAVNLDSFIIRNTPSSEKRDFWLYDSKSKWFEEISSSIKMPRHRMKESKSQGDEYVSSKLCSSIGSLISPDSRDGTYWNYRYVQSMNSGTPVITEWKESGFIGEPWMAMAPSIEEMSQENRDQLSAHQASIYLDNVGTKQSSYSNFSDVIKIGSVAPWIR